MSCRGYGTVQWGRQACFSEEMTFEQKLVGLPGRSWTSVPGRVNGTCQGLAGEATRCCTFWERKEVEPRERVKVGMSPR